MAENQNTGSDAGHDGADTKPVDTKAAEKLQKQLDTAQRENAQLKEQLAAKKADNETLATANQQLTGELAEKADELAKAEELLERQNAQLKAAEVGQALGPVVVTHANESYRVLAPKFQHHGLDVDAHTLRQNPDLVRELIESGSGLLVKVEAAA